MFEGIAVVSETRDEEDGAMCYEFDKGSHVCTLISCLHHMQHGRRYTDTCLLSEDTREAYHCHGVLLAAASSLFRKLFANNQMNFFRGTLHPAGASSRVLQSLLDYLYKPDLFSTLLSDTPAAREFLEKFELSTAFLESRFEPGAVLASLNEMYESRTLTYTVLKTSCGTEFPCHAAIVASVAPGLLPSDADENSYHPIMLEDCEAETLNQLLSFIYTASLSLHKSYAVDALSSYCRWRVPVLVTVTCEYLDKIMNPENVVIIYQSTKELAAKYKNKDCEKLQKSCIAFLKKNIKVVVTTKEFKARVTELEFHMLLVLVMFQVRFFTPMGQ